MSRPAGYIILTAEFWREDNQWVGLCRELGTSSFGNTLEEAREALGDLVMLHVRTLESLNERKAFFKAHGIVFHRTKPREGAPMQPVSVGFNRLVERLIEPIAHSAVAAV